MNVSKTNDRQLRLRLSTNSAKAVHQRFGIQSAEHINVPAIAAAVGVKVIEGKLDGAHARLLQGPVPTMRVSDAVPLEEQPFGVAHELGHFVGDHPPEQVQELCQRGRVRPVPKGYKRHPEAEANRFAAELLLPSTVLEKRFDAQPPSLHAALGAGVRGRSARQRGLTRPARSNGSNSRRVWPHQVPRRFRRNGDQAGSSPSAPMRDVRPDAAEPRPR